MSGNPFTAARPSALYRWGSWVGGSGAREEGGGLGKRQLFVSGETPFARWIQEVLERQR